MLRILPVLMVGVVLILFIRNAPARPLAINAAIHDRRIAQQIVSVLPALEGSAVSFDYQPVLASLPPDRDGLPGQPDAWARLEEGLVGKADGVRQRLLLRYEEEADPAYKGLLAVLLSADPATHRQILDDHLSHPKEGWDLFHGMALLALSRHPPES